MDLIWVVFVVINVWKFIIFSKVVFINWYCVKGFLIWINGLLLKIKFFFKVECIVYLNLKFVKYVKKFFGYFLIFWRYVILDFVNVKFLR